MPWSVSGVMEQRKRFVLDHQEGCFSMKELCARYEVSRQTGYKWLDRYRQGGEAALDDRSRAPKTSPQRIDSGLAALLLTSRERHPTWGPRKILGWLKRKHPKIAAELPAASTVGDLFRRHGLVQSRRRHRAHGYSVAGTLKADAPNEVWSADYKGEFRLTNGHYCFPFTLSDAYSRYVLSCQAEASTAVSGAKDALIEAFRRYGMPQAIRTDNGGPFVTHGLSGLSQLGVWWIQLGILHQRIPPARPDQNGRHERMHKTLKAEGTRPPEDSFVAQQARFDAWRQEFNQERPHEALDQQTPGSIYEWSPRPFPERLTPPEYPGHYERRKVDSAGNFNFLGQRLFIAHTLAGQDLGLIEIDDDLWSICFYERELGRLNPRTGNYVIKVSTMSPV